MTESALPEANEPRSREPHARLRAHAVRLATTAPLLQIACCMALAIAVAGTIDGFLTLTSVYSTLILASFLGLAAVGQTVVVLLGGVDLSLPALITGTNLVTVLLTGKGWSFAAVALVVLAACAGVGAINGYVIKRVGISPLIVTLATGAIVGGTTLQWTSNGNIEGKVPGWLAQFASPIGHTLGLRVPPVLVLWAVITVLLGIVLHRSAAGRRVYATGANPRAAELVGIRTARLWIGAFALSAISAGVVGLLLTGFIGSAQSSIGDQYLFASLTAVFVGGTSFVGARGDYMRTVLGALILTLITTLLIGHGAGAALQEIVFGALILVFVGIYGREESVNDRV